LRGQQALADALDRSDKALAMAIDSLTCEVTIAAVPIGTN